MSGVAFEIHRKYREDQEFLPSLWTPSQSNTLAKDKIAQWKNEVHSHSRLFCHRAPRGLELHGHLAGRIFHRSQWCIMRITLHLILHQFKINVLHIQHYWFIAQNSQYSHHENYFNSFALMSGGGGWGINLWIDTGVNRLQRIHNNRWLVWWDSSRCVSIGWLRIYRRQVNRGCDWWKHGDFHWISIIVVRWCMRLGGWKLVGGWNGNERRGGWSLE